MPNPAFVLVLLVVALFAWAWTRRREVFLYPATWILLFSTLLYMMPTLLFQEEITDMSPYTNIALLYCFAFVVGGLVMKLVVRAPLVLSRVPELPAKRRMSSITGRALLGVLGILGVINLYYLLNVPMESTGLYGVLFDPEHAAQLREESLKLLDNSALQYAYLIGFSALSPLAFALLLARAGELSGSRRWALMVLVLAFLAFYLLLTGARVGLVNLAVAGVMYAFLRKRMTLGLKPLLLAGVILFVVPMLMSFLREQGRNEASALEYVEAIGERIFLLPMLISGWFVEYADTRGPIGLLAAIGLGENINWSNLIALEFLDRKEAVTIETVTTPTAFMFSNYLYFGWLGLLPSWIALYLIDLPVDWARRAEPALRVPLLATLMYFSVIFVQSGFGVAWSSHGYLLLAGIAWVAIRRAEMPIADESRALLRVSNQMREEELRPTR